MDVSLRHRLSPIAAVVTLAVGMGFVSALHLMLALFEAPHAGSSVSQPLGDPPDRVDASETRNLELSCYDMSVQPIWSELKKSNAFVSSLQYWTGKLDCSELVEVKSLDTTRNQRNDELLARGKGQFCGATGNCLLWVFVIEDGKTRLVLESAGMEIEATRFKYDGLRAFRVHENGGNYPDSILEYRFSRDKYRLVTCFRQDKETLEKWRESCEGWE